MKNLVVAVLFGLFSFASTAQEPEMLAPDPAAPKEESGIPEGEEAFFPKLTGTKAKQAEDATTDFKGAGFGSGLAVVLDVGSNERISDAEVVNGIVRVKKDNDLGPRVLLNLHYFFSGACDEGKVGKWCREATVNDDGGARKVLIPMKGWGPFVAVEPGSEETINAVGGGILWGWRRQPDKSDSFNVGFGFLVDQNVKVLGDGIKANKPLPTGEMQIRFKEESRWGALLMASWAF